MPSLARLKTQALYIAGKEAVKNNLNDHSHVKQVRVFAWKFSRGFPRMNADNNKF